MRPYLITLLMLLAACGREAAAITALDLAPCPGWTGPRPATEGQFARAALAERAGRLCANAKLETVRSVIE